MRIRLKLPKVLTFLLPWFFLFLPISVFGQETAAELAKKVDEQLETGRVLQAMKWDPLAQKMVIFDPLVDREDSPKNFSLEAGSSYFILTDVRGVEFVDLPFEIVSPEIRDGWNLVPWRNDLIEKYEIKQITCFNPEFQQYEDIIIGFNDEVLPREGQGCWVYIGQGKETEGTPHAIYGEVTMEGKKVQATLSIINLTSGKQGITESGKDGKFVYDLLNLGWKSDDKILVSANADGVQKEIFLEVDPKVPNQRVEIDLAKLPREWKWKWQLILLAGLIFVGLIVLFIFIKKRKKK